MHWNSAYTHISSSARASAIVVQMVSRVESPPVLSLTMTRADGVAGEVTGDGAGGEEAGGEGAGGEGAGGEGARGEGARGEGARGEGAGGEGAGGEGAGGEGARGEGAGEAALTCGTLDIATSIFTCCSFVKCKKDPFSWVILLTPSLYCFCRYAGVQSMNLLFNCISSFISVLR